MDRWPGGLKTLLKSFLLFASLCLLAWAVLPSVRAYALGLLLGAAVSTVNALHLSYKIHLMTEHIVQGSNRRVNLGFLTRAAMGVLAVGLAYEIEGIDWVSATAGLFFAQAALLLAGFASSSDHSK